MRPCGIIRHAVEETQKVSHVTKMRLSLEVFEAPQRHETLFRYSHSIGAWTGTHGQQISQELLATMQPSNFRRSTSTCTSSSGCILSSCLSTLARLLVQQCPWTFFAQNDNDRLCLTHPDGQCKMCFFQTSLNVPHSCSHHIAAHHITRVKPPATDSLWLPKTRELVTLRASSMRRLESD